MPVGRFAFVRLLVHREGPDLALEDETVRDLTQVWRLRYPFSFGWAM